MAAYYNEIDPYAAQWLRNLIAAGHIAPGDVDERSIRDVHPADLIGYDQCHFFAGIGVWSHALRQAGWPDDRPVWTGSCPCQPFSAAGKRTGTADDRHLWPEFFRLIAALRPVAVFGEQVASKDGLAWLDAVYADLEGADYACGAVDLCAAGFGAPHIRQRLFFVAHSTEKRRERGGAAWHGRAGLEDDGAARQLADANDGGLQARIGPEARRRETLESECEGEPCELADADGRDASAEGLQRGREHGQQPQDGGAGGPVEYATGEQVGLPGRARVTGGSTDGLAHALPAGRPERRPVAGDGSAAGSGGADGIVGNTDDAGLEGRELPEVHPVGGRDGECSSREAGATNGFWRDADWLPCIDGKARPVEPGTFPLAHGIAGRVGRLRAYGNAIVAPVAAEFIRAYLGR